jgi:hypothetical protein
MPHASELNIDLNPRRCVQTDEILFSVLPKEQSLILGNKYLYSFVWKDTFFDKMSCQVPFQFDQNAGLDLNDALTEIPACVNIHIHLTSRQIKRIEHNRIHSRTY